MNNKPSRKIVICLAGLGLGNATRVHALIQSLEKASQDPMQITIFTWGRAENYFKEVVKKNNIELHSLRPYLSEGEGLYSLRSIFKNTIKFVTTYLLNNIKIWTEIKETQIAIFDSDFHFFPFLLKSVPVVSISQSPIICKEWMERHPNKSVVMWMHFFIFEYLELVVLLLFVRKIFNPCLGPNKVKWKKVVLCPPIVRKEFLEKNLITDVDMIAVSSGSPLYRRHLDGWVERYKMRHLSSFPGQYGLDPMQRPIISRAKRVLTQCGMSSLSECLAQEKFMFLDPVPNHPEQLINALIIEEQNMGMIISKENDSDQFDFQIEKKHDLKSAVECSGAKFIAEKLIELLRSYKN